MLSTWISGFLQWADLDESAVGTAPNATSRDESKTKRDTPVSLATSHTDTDSTFLRSTSSISSCPSTPVKSEAEAEAIKLFDRVTPPKLPNSECAALSASYGIAWDKCNNHEKQVLWFLLDRKVHKALERDAHGNKNEIVRNRLREAMDKTSEVGQRVSVILYQRGQTFSTTVPGGVQSYEQFLEKCPLWKSEMDWNQPRWDETTFINVLEGPSALEVFQAAQLSKNCYLHGPVSVYQYLHQWHRNDDDQNDDDQDDDDQDGDDQNGNVLILMRNRLSKCFPQRHQNDNDQNGNRVINIPRYMQHTFSSEDIKTHVFDGKGGRSENIFKKLVKEGTKEEEADKATICYFPVTPPYSGFAAANFGFEEKSSLDFLVQTYFALNLRSYGPFLFSEVLLPSGFGANNVHTYKGADWVHQENDIRHSLVLLGVRKVTHATDRSKDSWMFLFQNWYKDTQFFEADYDWVYNCRGIFWYLAYDKGKWPRCEIEIDREYTVPNEDAAYRYAEALSPVDRGGTPDKTKSDFCVG